MAWSDAARAAALEVRRRKSKVTMYHGTSSEAANRILKEGFRPLRAGNRYSDEWYAGSPRFATYMTPSRHWAKTFAARAAFEKGAKSGGAILTVRLPTRKVTVERGGTFYYARGVSKARIVGVERLKRKGWIWEEQSRQLREIRNDQRKRR